MTTYTVFNRICMYTLSAILILGVTANSAIKTDAQEQLKNLWDMDEIRKTPLNAELVSTREENGYRVDGLYITSEMTSKGPNRIFCYFARPQKHASKVPVSINLTGGGGDDRLAMWMAQSMKCAAMDIEWRNTTSKYRSKWSDGADRNIYSVIPTVKDSFGYHLVIAIRRAIDYLEEQPEVDSSRVSCCGGSMGGFYSLFAAGVDPRIRCVGDTYGAGGFGKSRSAIGGTVMNLPFDKQKLWIAAYDPITYTSQTKGSVFMYLGANDYFFWLGDALRNYKALPGDKRLLILPNFNHNIGAINAVIPADPWMEWTNICLQGGLAFPEVSIPKTRHNIYSWRATGADQIIKSSLYWSPGKAVWPSRYWLEIPAQEKDGVWRAEIPKEFAELTAEIFVTVFSKAGRAVSSLVVSRRGLDPQIQPGPLWQGKELWDKSAGISAWRTTGASPNSGPDKVFAEMKASGSFRIGPAQGETRFALLTNSVILASGCAAVSGGIRVVVNGNGQPGKLSIILQRDSQCSAEISYVKTVSYGAEKTVLTLPWSDFKGPTGSSDKPYPFDGLRLDGERPDGTAITVEALELLPADSSKTMSLSARSRD